MLGLMENLEMILFFYFQRNKQFYYGSIFFFFAKTLEYVIFCHKSENDIFQKLLFCAVLL